MQATSTDLSVLEVVAVLEVSLYFYLECYKYSSSVENFQRVDETFTASTVSIDIK